MPDTSPISKILNAEFEKRRGKDSKYTVSAFARDLDVAPSTLHQVLKGSRTLSLKKAAALLDRIGADAVQKASFFQAASIEASSNPETRSYRVIDVPFAAESSWLNYAVLSAFELEDFASDEEWFSQRLGHDVEEIRTILQHLEDAGIIQRSTKPWTMVRTSFTAEHGAHKIAALRKVHSEYIKKSLDYLDNAKTCNTLLFANPDEEMAAADISGSTFSIDAKRLPEAFNMIRVFRRSLAEYLCAGPTQLQASDVYRLNIQLFPISRQPGKH